MTWRHNLAVLLRSPRARIALYGAVILLALVVWTVLGRGDSASPPPRGSPSAAVQRVPPTATPVPTVPATATGQLETAERLLRDGDAVAAAEAYLGIAQTNPGARPEALLGAGIARFEAGDRDGSIEALRSSLAAAPGESPTKRRAAYLLGLRLNEAGQAAQAVAVLKPMADSSTVDALQPYILSEYARAAANSGDAATAARTWDAIIASPGASNALRAVAYKDRADAAATAGDSAGVAMWLSRLVTIQPDPSIRYDLAAAAKARGDSPTFAAQLRAVIDESPSSPFASRAIADLKDAGYAIDAGKEGFVYYRRGAYAEARRVLTAAVAEPGISAPQLAFRSYYLAAAYEDGGNLSTAVTYYDRAASADPQSPTAHRAQYWAARSVESLGDPRSASARYSALVKTGPGGEFTFEAAFRAGFTLFSAGDAAAAISTWDSLGLQADARLLYWKARAYERIGNATAARGAYGQSASVGPFDFYGLLSAKALGQSGSIDVAYRTRSFPRSVDWASIEAWLAQYAGPKPSAVYPATPARDFMAVGLRDRASAVIMGEATDADQWRLIGVIKEAYDAGLISTAARLTVMLRESTGVSPALVPKAVTQLSYPVDYVTSLDEAARSGDVDPLFLAALIRQESFWDPAAVSPAGAIGLTQVIPPTGEAIARSLGISGWTSADLLRPAISLRFGAYYIGGQLKRYGDPLAALAAYNAGPGNAIRWTERVNPANAADFIEAIDIPETQHYVQSVMEYYALYRRAYDSGSP